MTASSSAASDFPPEEPTADRVQVREISSEEGNRLPRVLRRDSGSVVSWRRPQIVAAVRVLGAGVTHHVPRLSAASRSVRLAGTAHGGVALQIPSGRWASSQPACTNR